MRIQNKKFFAFCRRFVLASLAAFLLLFGTTTGAGATLCLHAQDAIHLYVKNNTIIDGYELEYSGSGCATKLSVNSLPKDLQSKLEDSIKEQQISDGFVKLSSEHHGMLACTIFRNYDFSSCTWEKLNRPHIYPNYFLTKNDQPNGIDFLQATCGKCHFTMALSQESQEIFAARKKEYIYQAIKEFFLETFFNGGVPLWMLVGFFFIITSSYNFLKTSKRFGSVNKYRRTFIACILSIFVFYACSYLIARYFGNIYIYNTIYLILGTLIYLIALVKISRFFLRYARKYKTSTQGVKTP